ncbi:unnamed protein product [Symbiodinium sp. CCMP2592]|nr:unnamed protein product [Symbiodinium sp. CCMP2592]
MSGRTCPKCGSNVPPDSRFCWNCGFKLSDTPGHEAALQTGASPDAFPPLNGFSPYTSPAPPLPMTKPLSESRILAGQASASLPAELEAVSDACRGGRSLLPLAVVGDVTGDGKADALYPVDADRNGVPDVLEEILPAVESVEARERLLTCCSRGYPKHPLRHEIRSVCALR